LVLYHWNKNEFVCASSTKNIWYIYKDNRWKENDGGIDLRKCISGKVRDLYNNKSISIMQNISNSNSQMSINIDNDSDSQKSNDINKTRQIQTLSIIQRLGSTSDKSKIMTEAKELFYDGSFLENLDTNPYLLCFNNGVIDFKEKVFRKGRPEDCLSYSTNINYIKLTEQHNPIVEEIKTFMNQLFPRPELCQYMWEHLASSLIGIAIDQTFNMYYGGGQNGKSVLTNLMKKALGDYFCDVPLSLITGKRGGTGSLSPEVALLKGKRYALMQEPSKDDVINEGVMKQYTSGKDPIQARMLHCPPISFLPQFKLVVTCNLLMQVNANDYGTWRRIRTVPFESLFTYNPENDNPDKPFQFKIDKQLDEKFDKWAEVFASMLVEVAFKTDGHVKSCGIVTSKSDEYRQSQDYYSEYVKERIVKDQSGRIKKMELNKDFALWYSSNYGSSTPKTKELHELMDKKFGVQKRQAWQNVRICYELNQEDDEDIDDDFDDDIIPEDL
jgi:P4 family phage/plasmid primase-like protien